MNKSVSDFYLKPFGFEVIDLKLSMVKIRIFFTFFSDVFYSGDVFLIWNAFFTIEIAISQVINGKFFFGAEICTIANT